MTTVDTVVIGAGQAGLAAAAALQTAGIEVVVLEQSAIGATWRGHYDRLRLNTDRRLSSLPGLAIPKTAGQWPSRDDFVAYLETYARHHDLDIRPATVSRLDRLAETWHLAGTDLQARRVVIATGGCRVPVLPWEGTLHSGRYRNATPYRGQEVLVVGGGNSGAEIAADLARSGVRVQLSLRDQPALLPRSYGPLPAQFLGFGLHLLPGPVGDLALWSSLTLTRFGDRKLGLRAPARVLSAARKGAVPVLDAGLVDAVRRGLVEIVPAVAGVTDGLVTLVDGSTRRPNTIVAATGWRPGLEPLVGHLEVLDSRGRPRKHGGPEALPGLHFVGFGNPLTGYMHAAGHDAAALAAAVTGSNALAGALRQVRRLIPLPA